MLREEFEQIKQLVKGVVDREKAARQSEIDELKKRIAALEDPPKEMSKPTTKAGK